MLFDYPTCFLPVANHLVQCEPAEHQLHRQQVLLVVQTNRFPDQFLSEGIAQDTAKIIVSIFLFIIPPSLLNVENYNRNAPFSIIVIVVPSVLWATTES
jgi:hypothetical protein